MPKHALPSLAALVCCAAVLAGCGGGDRSAIRETLERSPQSLLHYTDSAWWGREPDLGVTYAHVDHYVAVVEVAERGGFPQRATLNHHGDVWDIGSIGVGFVRGPREARPATRAERRPLLADARRVLPRDCARAAASVSRVDPRYAFVRFSNGSTPCRRPLHGLLYRRSEGQWRRIAVVGFPTVRGRSMTIGFVLACRRAPAGVIRSLDGWCLAG